MLCSFSAEIFLYIWSGILSTINNGIVHKVWVYNVVYIWQMLWKKGICGKVITAKNASHVHKTCVNTFCAAAWIQFTTYCAYATILLDEICMYDDGDGGISIYVSIIILICANNIVTSLAALIPIFFFLLSASFVVYTFTRKISL